MQERRWSYALRGALGFGMGGLLAGIVGAAASLLSDDLLPLMIPLSFVAAIGAPTIAAAVLIEDATMGKRLSGALIFGCLFALYGALVSGLVGLVGIALPAVSAVGQGQSAGQVSHIFGRSIGFTVLIGPLAASFSSLYLCRFLRVAAGMPLLVWLSAFVGFGIAGVIVGVLTWVTFTPSTFPSFSPEPASEFLRPLLEYLVGGYFFGLGLDWLAAIERR